MKFVELIIEKRIKITNMIGTILVAWISSALVTTVISWLIASPAPVMPSVASKAAPAASAFQGQTYKNIAYYMPICERNLFDSAKQSPCREEEPVYDSGPTIDYNAAPVKSSIGAKLIGTMVAIPDTLSFATIEESGAKSPKNMHIGDRILGEASIYQIERNRVFFTYNGRKEYLEVDRMPSIYKNPPPPGTTPSSSATKIENGKVSISKAKVEATVQDMNKVLQDARMVPNYENGQVNGFKIFGIRGGSIFQELGLQNGDVVNQINGTSIDSIDKALPMLELLKTEASFTIDINRRGQKQSLQINVQ